MQVRQAYERFDIEYQFGSNSLLFHQGYWLIHVQQMRLKKSKKSHLTLQERRIYFSFYTPFMKALSYHKRFILRILLQK